MRTYRCNSRAVQGRCPSPQHVVGAHFDDYMAEQFNAHLRHVTGAAQPSSTELTAARAELAELEDELAAFAADLEVARRLRAVGQYAAALEAGLQAVERARSKLDGLTRSTLGAELSELADWRFAIDEWCEQADPQTRKTALAAAVDAVFLRGPGKGGSLTGCSSCGAARGPTTSPAAAGRTGRCDPSPGPRSSNSKPGWRSRRSPAMTRSASAPRRSRWRSSASGFSPSDATRTSSPEPDIRTRKA